MPINAGHNSKSNDWTLHYCSQWQHFPQKLLDWAESVDDENKTERLFLAVIGIFKNNLIDFKQKDTLANEVTILLFSHCYNLKINVIPTRASPTLNFNQFDPLQPTDRIIEVINWHDYHFDLIIHTNSTTNLTLKTTPTPLLSYLPTPILPIISTPPTPITTTPTYIPPSPILTTNTPTTQTPMQATAPSMTLPTMNTPVFHHPTKPTAINDTPNNCHSTPDDYHSTITNQTTATESRMHVIDYHDARLVDKHHHSTSNTLLMRNNLLT